MSISSALVRLLFRWCAAPAGCVQNLPCVRTSLPAPVTVAGGTIARGLSRGLVSTSLLVAVLAGLCGCAKPEPTADPAPFEAAVAQYLSDNNMALKLKEIRHGPTVAGDHATMSASLTHRELGGPSVVWTFEFDRSGAGAWKAVRHSDK